MCGFTVVLRRSGLTPDDASSLQACIDGMPYRGPDENGIWRDDHVGLGHVRLSIIGLSNGHQPLFSADESLVLVCNGEIYNHHELRARFQAEGAVFLTQSDSEVLIHAYRAWGDDFLQHVDGMFAFVLYDRQRGRLLCGRDHAGKKPLYYSETADSAVFSSEVKAVRRFVERPGLNAEVIRQVQAQRYSISDVDTYVVGIHKVPPGHLARVGRDEALAITPWYTCLPEPTFDGSYDEAVDRTRTLLYRAVERRLESEVPLALLLSAGIDSSAIACIAHRLGHPLKTFSAGFSDRSANDESFEARALADHLGLDFTRVEIDQSDFRRELPTILSFMDEPNGDPSQFAQWYLYKAVRANDYTVLLSGIGGDEIFYGYPPANQAALTAPSQKGGRLRQLMAGLSGGSMRGRLELLHYLVTLSLYRRSLSGRAVLEEVSELAERQGRPRLAYTDMENDRLPLAIDRHYSRLFRTYLPNNGYFLADKLGMAHSLEVRCPFADRDMRAFVATLPLAWKFPDGRAKGLLKDALRGIVPDAVLDRRKTGFTPPSIYVLEAVKAYRNRFFDARLTTLAQVATDYYCADLAAADTGTAP